MCDVTEVREVAADVLQLQVAGPDGQLLPMQDCRCPDTLGAEGCGQELATVGQHTSSAVSWWGAGMTAASPWQRREGAFAEGVTEGKFACSGTGMTWQAASPMLVSLTSIVLSLGCLSFTNTVPVRDSTVLTDRATHSH